MSSGYTRQVKAKSAPQLFFKQSEGSGFFETEWHIVLNYREIFWPGLRPSFEFALQPIDLLWASTRPRSLWMAPRLPSSRAEKTNPPHPGGKYGG